MARPIIEINPKLVFQFARDGCTLQEIADYCGCSHDTIERRFASELEKGRSQLRRRLRRWQIRAAKNGNVVMMIWLGKQLLGQVERTQIDITKIDDHVFAQEAQRRLKDESGNKENTSELLTEENVSEGD